MNKDGLRILFLLTFLFAFTSVSLGIAEIECSDQILDACKDEIGSGYYERNESYTPLTFQNDSDHDGVVSINDTCAPTDEALERAEKLSFVEDGMVNCIELKSNEEKLSKLDERQGLGESIISFLPLIGLVAIVLYPLLMIYKLASKYKGKRRIYYLAYWVLALLFIPVSLNFSQLYIGFFEGFYKILSLIFIPGLLFAVFSELVFVRYSSVDSKIVRYIYLSSVVFWFMALIVFFSSISFA
jgi:hypothetical protein